MHCGQFIAVTAIPFVLPDRIDELHILVMASFGIFQFHNTVIVDALLEIVSLKSPLS